MTKFVNINVDTDAARLQVIAEELWPGQGRGAQVNDGRWARITCPDDETDALTAALDSRGIDWGWA